MLSYADRIWFPIPPATSEEGRLTHGQELGMRRDLKYLVPQSLPVDPRLAAMCRLAITAQFGVNLSGIVKDLNEVCGTLWGLAREQDEGTGWVNQHPICQLYAAKIVEMTGVGMPSSDEYAAAGKWVQDVLLRIEREERS